MSKIQQYEYQSFYLSCYDIVDKLNEKGQQGWRVCMKVPLVPGGGEMVIMERPLQDDIADKQQTKDQPEEI